MSLRRRAQDELEAFRALSALLNEALRIHEVFSALGLSIPVPLARLCGDQYGQAANVASSVPMTTTKEQP